MESTAPNAMLRFHRTPPPARTVESSSRMIKTRSRCPFRPGLPVVAPTVTCLFTWKMAFATNVGNPSAHPAARLWAIKTINAHIARQRSFSTVHSATWNCSLPPRFAPSVMPFSLATAQVAIMRSWGRRPPVPPVPKSWTTTSGRLVTGLPSLLPSPVQNVPHTLIHSAPLVPPAELASALNACASYSPKTRTVQHVAQIYQTTRVSLAPVAERWSGQDLPPAPCANKKFVPNAERPSLEIPAQIVELNLRATALAVRRQ